jgi:hypothetical protein
MSNDDKTTDSATGADSLDRFVRHFFRKQGNLRWLQIGRAEIFLRGWQWAWRDGGNWLTIAFPGIVIRWRKY